MRNKVKVQVTEEDIENGACGDSKYCPVANAIKRKYKRDKRAVRPTKVAVGSDGHLWLNGYEYNYSPDVERKIIHFDTTGEMEPFEFEAWKEESK